MPTKSEVLLTVESYKSIPDHIAATHKTTAVRSHSVISFCHWAISSRARHESDVEQFFSKLMEGHSLKIGDPVLSARNRLIQMVGKGSPNERAELIFRAWNLHIKGATQTRGIPLSGGALPKLER